MSQWLARRRARGWILAGIILILSSSCLYVFDRTASNYREHLQTAEAHNQARYYPAAISAYQHVLDRIQAWDIRLFNLIFGHRIRAAWIRLALANTHYRQAEAALRQYQSEAHTSANAAKPTLTAVQRLLTTAIQAFDTVPQTDPRVYVSAQINAGRAEAWQLLLAATQEQTRGQRTLRQMATQTIERVAQAIDFAHQHQFDWPRQERMTAILLLENLTRFSQEHAAPRPAKNEMGFAIALGDLLMQDQPELSAEARQRFQQFFFAMPFEADNPWPTQSQDKAGATTPQALH